MEKRGADQQNLLHRNIAVTEMLDQHSAVTQQSRATPVARLLLAQGGYYVATGIWPLISMRTFERVTGPKIDKWLVKTVGVLVTAIGSTLTLAAARKDSSPEARLLAIASAASLTAIDVVYVAQRRIAPIYLLDAAAELALIGGWWLMGGSGTEKPLTKTETPTRRS
jgi:hypothetical protein